jgi:hypothetical protein
LVPEVAVPVFEMLPLESSLARAFNGDDALKKKTLESAFELLTAKAVECYGKQSLAAFLIASVPPANSPAGLLNGFAEASEMLSRDLENVIQPLLKQACLEQRRCLRKQLEESKADEGSHAVAQLLRTCIAIAMMEASGKVSIGGMANSAWTVQKEEQKRRQLEECAQADAEALRRAKELSKGRGNGKKYKFTGQTAHAKASRDKKFNHGGGDRD